MAHKAISDLMNKEMDRKSFLKHTGIAILALTGFSALIGTLTNFGKPHVTSGYGISAYGGTKERT